MTSITLTVMFDLLLSVDHNGDTDLEDLDEDEKREILEAQELAEEYERSIKPNNKEAQVTDEKLTAINPTVKLLKIKLPKLPPAISNIRTGTRKQCNPKKSGVKKKTNNMENGQNAVASDVTDIKTEPVDDVDVSHCVLSAESHEIDEVVHRQSATEGSTVEKSPLNGETNGTVDNSRRDDEILKDKQHQQSYLVNSSHVHLTASPSESMVNGNGKVSNTLVDFVEDESAASDMALMKVAYTKCRDK